MPEAPYYESRYIRANHPEQPQALWLRETLLLPTAGDPVADVWVMVFDPDGAGQPGAQAAVPDRRRRLRVRRLDRAHRRDVHRRPVGAGRRDGRKPLGAMGSADHAGIRGRGQTPHRPRVQGAHPDGQDNGAPPAGPVRRAGGARRRPARARRLDRQRQPQLGHAAHPGLRVRPGVRLRRRAGLEPGDRDGAGRDRTGLAACGHAVRVPARRAGIRGSLDPRQPADRTAGISRSHGRSGRVSGTR